VAARRGAGLPQPDKGFFAVSRFADVLETLHDWKTYSSGKGITLEGLPPDVQPEMITMDPRATTSCGPW